MINTIKAERLQFWLAGALRSVSIYWISFLLSCTYTNRKCSINIKQKSNHNTNQELDKNYRVIPESTQRQTHRTPQSDLSPKTNKRVALSKSCTQVHYLSIYLIFLILIPAHRLLLHHTKAWLHLEIMWLTVFLKETIATYNQPANFSTEFIVTYFSGCIH